MERLTYDFCIGGNHCWQVKGADNLECREVCQRQEDKGCKDCPIAKAFDRLAAYEDTGLEPEEIAKIREDVESGYLKSTARRYGISVDRLRELAQADREGRCVVLPCKVGDTLYRIQRFKRGKNWRKEAEFIRTVELNRNNFWRIVMDGEIGATVFLTRADAEAALRREQDENL